MEKPTEANGFQGRHVKMMRRSLKLLTGLDLLADSEENSSEQEFGRQVFEAGFALVSHDSSCDPIFNYANQTALDLFEMSWKEFTSLPSRISAEQVHREEREAMMNQVRTKEVISNYQGVRISKNGNRFWIERAVVWNLLNDEGEVCGQAARFSEWKPL